MLLRLLFSLVWWATLLGALVVTVAGILLAAPVPTVRPKAPAPLREGPVTADDLRGVRAMTWGSHTWHLTLETATGEGYQCRIAGDDNKPSAGMVWSGPCWLEGGEVILEESCYRVRPDSPPEHLGGPREVRLQVRWEKGRMVGRGWGGPVRFLREGEVP